MTRPNRLMFLDEHLWRWILFCKSDEQEFALRYMGERVLPDRLTLILYIVSKFAKIFPINLLRNVGIRNVRTTHYVVMDMDMWPIQNLHSEMTKIPLKVLQDRKSAIIIPLLFFDLQQILPNCTSLISCITEDLKYFPYTVEELNTCLLSGMCRYNRGKLKTHVDKCQYAVNRSAPPVLKVNCMLNAHQEPYYFLQRHQDTPLFDPLFVNYGYNKMEHMDEIRAKDFQFYLVTHSFAMDMAHQKSEMGIRRVFLWNQFMRGLKEFGPQKMKGVCLDFQNKKPNSPVYI
ncbi:glycosyltransferase-like protein [Blastocystis sp. subtype 4]|uniref:glycosyltransferase-like protein n=1 Tax=Blastocystis sp. subtype 4 TaxID=944170 RepID=UPI0007112FBE|nr:glycosyltransferase-like protein [Blastocystis sp. subtype 4]KNB44068.1 glycosyltransferase-like protein [Blastocystis sp. subtype 4]|eukprot:XP_014527508.1 glycosyltransferase-like protein [Blastocystis sp. subtype 4]